MNTPLNKAEAKRLIQRFNQKLKAPMPSRSDSIPSRRTQLVFESFLKRLFNNGAHRWILGGGAALLMRSGKGRFTQDLDLVRKSPWESPEEVELELKTAADSDSSDPFTFKIKKVETNRHADPDGYFGPSLKVTVSALMGASLFENFSIDVIVHRHTQAPVRQVLVDPLINEIQKDQTDPFTVFTTPIESHLSDKICAMYEQHSNRISTRHHDLADIITIILNLEFSGLLFRETLSHEAKRRGVEILVHLSSPGNAFTQGYERKAPTYLVLPEQFHSMDAALQLVNECLGPALAGEADDQVWNPHIQVWEPTVES